MWKYDAGWNSAVGAASNLITPSLGNKDIHCKTFQITIKDNVQALQLVNTSFGWVAGNTFGNSKGLKAMIPGDATITGFSVFNNAQANTSGTGAAGNLLLGRPVDFASITANGTTATVVCQYPHGLTASDVIHVSDTGVTNFNTVGVGGTIQNNQPKTVTPDASDPTKFTYTISSTTATATTGLIVCASYYVNQSVISGGLATGNQWLTSVKNVGTFAATTPSAYWQAAASGTFGGTPPVWCVSPRLDPQMGPPGNYLAKGTDGNYNYFVEPTKDLALYAYYQEYATSGFTAATSGGPWTVFVYYFR